MFFFGGGLSLNSPTTQQSAAEGGGVQPRFPDHRAIGNRCGIFFCGTPPVRLCWAQTGHYMSDRHNTPLLYSQETGMGVRRRNPYKPKGPSKSPPTLAAGYSRDTAFRNTHGLLQPTGRSWSRISAPFARSGPGHWCAAELPNRSLAWTWVPPTSSPSSASPICPNSH